MAMIHLEPQTAQMFSRALGALKPPPNLTLSQWADNYRRLSAEASAAQGRWNTDNAPFQREIMDAMQNDNKNGGYTYKGLRVVLGGRPKELDPGKLKRADTMGSTTTLEVTRYLMEVDGTTVIDIDKFAGRYYVDGEDMRAEINALI